MAVTAGSLCRLLPELSLEGDASIGIETVTVDSRHCGPGSLFVAVRGSSRDGHDFVAAAVEAGCSAVLVDKRGHNRFDTTGWPSQCAILVAEDTRRLPALVARECAGRPDDSLMVAGVTGTNGKTTVAYLLREMLAEVLGPCGLLGTVCYETGASSSPAPLTTPDGPTLYRLLGEMHESGRLAAALEISSHALTQGRTAGLALDLAVLTNLSRDHLDYHGDMASYLEAKLGILDLLRERSNSGKALGAVAINIADPAFARLDTGRLRTLRFCARPELSCEAELRVESSRLGLEGTCLNFATPDGPMYLESPLVGRFNVENLTAALAGGIVLGLPVAECVRALAGVSQVPGRLERFELPNGALAVVDYAHTDDALAAVLGACRELGPRKLLLVCGCGGDRDRGKRPLMGAVAARLADRTWLTSDNPRSEDPAAICAAMEEGFRAGAAEISSPAEAEVSTVLDRRTAIVQALDAAAQGDIVIVAGKGHEDYQLVGDRRLHLDDREIVREWIHRGSARE